MRSCVSTLAACCGAQNAAVSAPKLQPLVCHCGAVNLRLGVRATRMWVILERHCLSHALLVQPARCAAQHRGATQNFDFRLLRYPLSHRVARIDIRPFVRARARGRPHWRSSGASRISTKLREHPIRGVFGPGRPWSSQRMRSSVSMYSGCQPVPRRTWPQSTALCLQPSACGYASTESEWWCCCCTHRWAAKCGQMPGGADYSPLCCCRADYSPLCCCRAVRPKLSAEQRQQLKECFELMVSWLGTFACGGMDVAHA